MEIIQKSAPHLRKPNASVVRMMRDVVIALLPLVVFAIYNHGMTAVWIMLAAILSMVGTEYIYYQIRDLVSKDKFTVKNKSFTLYNYSIIVSGIIYGLTIPDATPIMVVIIGGVMAVLLAKLVFGGMGQNIFNIAAFGRAFIALSFGAAVGVSNFVDSTAGATVLGFLGGTPFADVTAHYSLMDMFTGIGLPGTLGETSAMLILVGGLYLALRKSFDIFVPLVYVGTVFVLSLAVMVRIEDLSWWYPLTHILSGGLLFGAVFMATDPITIPVTRPGRIYFAFGLGIITFVIRLFGQYPEGVVFAILIMNIFVPAIDYPQWSKSKFSWRSALIFAVVVLLSIFAVWVGANYVG